MTRTIRDALQMPVIARANAEQLGAVAGVVVNADAHRFEALYIGGPKRHPQFIDWSAITSFGEDAVIVNDASVAREPESEAEERVAKDRTRVLDQRVLDSLGDGVGIVSDVTFDADSGIIETIEIGEHRVLGDQLRGVGNYAVVINAPS